MNIVQARRPFHLSLYLVANRPSYPNENVFISQILKAVQGGVSCVQLRDDKSNFESTVKIASFLKRNISVPLFINTLNLFEVADAVDADGVYLEEPFPYSEARKRLGHTKIIGVPVKTIDEVLLMNQTDVDYLSVKVSASKKTCPKNDVLWGMKGLEKARMHSSHRMVAIGGLNAECAEDVYRELHREDGIAMAGGLMDADQPDKVVEKILSIWRCAHHVIS